MRFSYQGQVIIIQISYIALSNNRNGNKLGKGNNGSTGKNNSAEKNNARKHC